MHDCLQFTEAEGAATGGYLGYLKVACPWFYETAVHIGLIVEKSANEYANVDDAIEELKAAVTNVPSTEGDLAQSINRAIATLKV